MEGGPRKKWVVQGDPTREKESSHGTGDILKRSGSQPFGAGWERRNSGGRRGGRLTVQPESELYEN